MDGDIESRGAAAAAAAGTARRGRRRLWAADQIAARGADVERRAAAGRRRPAGHAGEALLDHSIAVVVEVVALLGHREDSLFTGHLS